MNVWYTRFRDELFEREAAYIDSTLERDFLFDAYVQHTNEGGAYIFWKSLYDDIVTRFRNLVTFKRSLDREAERLAREMEGGNK